MFTHQSLVRLTFVVQATKVEFKSMLTLTYPIEFKIGMLAGEYTGKQSKKALHTVLVHLKRKYDSEYLWFCEFTKQGLVHYHILSTIDAITPKMRFDLATVWINQIFHSHDVLSRYYSQDKINMVQSKAARVCLHKNTWQLAKKPDGMRRYATKYAAKRQQKIAPDWYHDAGRFWGHSKGVQPEAIDISSATEERVTKWLQECKGSEFVKKCEVVPKHLWGMDVPF